jgi:hypothetical protein
MARRCCSAQLAEVADNSRQRRVALLYHGDPRVPRALWPGVSFWMKSLILTLADAAPVGYKPRQQI